MGARTAGGARSTRRPAPRWLALDDPVALPEPAPPRRTSTLPEAGERPRSDRWTEFRDERLTAYKTDRDKPGVDGTSRLSVHLKYGEIHPRTLLADLASRSGVGAATFRTELAWREFYADVLWHHPDSARRVPATGVRRAWRTTSPGDAFDGVAARAHRLPRSSTPACASCAPRAGCTTGCG